MEILKQLTFLIVPSLGFIWLINFCLVAYYRYQEEKLYKELDRKIIDIRNQIAPTSSIEGSIGHLQGQYQRKLDELDRKKQFLRDIIPFLKSS